MESKIRRLYIAIVICLLLTPFVYLLFKTAPQWAGGKGFRQTTGKPNETTAAINPKYYAYINLSVTYINNNQPEKSLDPLEKAKALKPDSAVVYNNLGVAYIMLKRFDEGIAACRRAIELDPAFQRAKNNLRWGLDEKDKLRKK
jgi:tetratricopeptide (TPR) repeat protein